MQPQDSKIQAIPQGQGPIFPEMPAMVKPQIDKQPPSPVLEPTTPKIVEPGDKVASASSQKVEYEYPPGKSKISTTEVPSAETDESTRAFQSAMSKLIEIKDSEMEAIKQSEEALEKSLGPIQKMFELVESNGGSDIKDAFVNFARLIADNSEARELLQKALKEDSSNKSLW